MSFGDRIKKARQGKGLTQEQLAKMIGVAKSTLTGYEKGNREPDVFKIKALSAALDITGDYLLGTKSSENILPFDLSVYPNLMPMPEMKKVPLLGTIACGQPILAEENLDGFAELPREIQADFALKCKGDSMTGARIYDGDIVYIHQQTQVLEGEIAAVLIDDEATLKRVRYLPGGMVMLEACNPAFAPIYLGGSSENREVRILGKAVYFLSFVR